ITSIPTATIRRIANEFVAAARVGSTIVLDGMEFPLRPAMVWPKRGALSQADGAYVHLASKMIQGLVGALDVPGGDVGSGVEPRFDLRPNEDGVVTPRMEAVGHPFKFPPDDVQLSSFYPLRHTAPFLAWRAIVKPEEYFLPYNVEMLIVYGGNSIINNAAPDEPLKAFKKIPFVVSIAYHFDEPAEMADLLLPESSNLEREMMVSPGTGGKGLYAPLLPSGVMYRFPVVPLIYNTKQGDEILLELARRLELLGGPEGVNARFNRSLRLTGQYALEPGRVYTVTEIIDRRLKSQFGLDKGVEHFRKVGYELELLGPRQFYNYASYPMGKTRYHFFWEHVKMVGDRMKAGCEERGITVPGWEMADLLDHYRPIPHWRPMPIHKEPAEYDMFFVNWKTPFVLFGLGATVENPWLNEISQKTDPYQMVLCMNPATAARKGLKEGDLVEVESQWGRLTGQVKLSELFHPEVIGTPGNYGRRSMHMNPIALAGPNYNQLLSPDDGTFDPVNTALVISPRVKVRKVGR
ncbi:MAG TPA: molybdopterin dinucleotide binding domain-containing protein, partial [Dehalococcoidia bacterium]|nr:molybdopterin dinucleotide binding domain-containing protein [Dehalococcoidia bacterium]